MPAITEAEAHQVLAETPFSQTFGFRLGTLGPGECTLVVPFNDAIVRLGQRLIYGTAECRNREGALLTHHTRTFIRPEN